MFNSKKRLCVWLVIVIALTPLRVLASDYYSVQLYFGLSIPDGSGVTMKQWDAFLSEQIVPRFAGFNVVDSVGYWQGEPERAKIVTIVMKAASIPDAEAIARLYARMFHQDSVMMVQHPVAKLEFVTEKEPERSK
ncbi:DUF3574 domain-containing protein [Motilimonas sp. E26]|uniref:DUF3574 domain-containing protein n=1 Tax=Motilimonas TaxID=1914248 RepID=UPI001E46BAC9|nr:DUF3574 domain-containing protein [Motilimonas sp. E26]MCE0557400.1 DUF3574 domain-containing protein [Motilimonas sp. E26]